MRRKRSWRFLDQQELLYYCALKTNRRVDESGGTALYVVVPEKQEFKRSPEPGLEEQLRRNGKVYAN